MDPTSTSTSAVATPPSRWALATLGDREALRELAGSYWYCAYAWWRRAGLDAGHAATATLASFTRWITVAPPGAEDSGAGLMRVWLPARLAELAAQGVKLVGEPAIVIEREWAEARYAEEPEGDLETVFQRRWTLTVLEFTMQTLRAEYAERGQEALFGEMGAFAGFEGGDDAHYAAAADRAGFTVGATRRAVFDFRKRHRELLRSYVADTVADPADLDSEITALLCACDLPMAPDAAPAPLPTAIRTFKPDELLARAMNSVRMTSGGAGLWKPPSDAEIARLFPQYEMLGMLGRGGMGAVYRARQVALDRQVAIKLLPLEVSVDRDFADRFVREARAMAKLNHPHIITVFDFGTTGEGHLFFVMEYVEGANLAEIIHGPGLSAEQAMAIAGQVCTALAYAHGKGVVHRDIKPANVMVDTEGTAKVADFGLARMTEAGAEQFGHTVTGTVMGTPDYMAPEQKRGMAVDHRADIFSVGVMLYEMLCKETPQGAYEPPSQRAGCDARLDQIVIKAMSRTPEGRYQSTTEMKADLDAARTPLPHPAQLDVAAPPAKLAADGPANFPPAKKSRTGLLAGIAAAVLVLAGAAFFLSGEKKPDAKPTVQTATPAPPPAATPAPAAVVSVAPVSTPAPVPVPRAEPPAVVAMQPEPKPAEAPPAIPARAEREPGWTNLLAGVDVQRDAVIGDWRMENGELLSPAGAAAHQTIVLPVKDVPAQYDLRYRLTRRERGAGVFFALRQGSAAAAVIVDGWTGNKENSSEVTVRFVGPEGKRNMGGVVNPRHFFQLGEEHELLIQVREDRVAVSLDGKEVLHREGGLSGLTQAERSYLPGGRRKDPVFAVGVCAGSAAFHSIELKPLDAVPVAAAPAPPAPVVASNDPRLVQLEAAFKARFDSDAQKPYLAAVAALNQSYLVNGLARVRAAAQAKGNLDEVTALDAEKAAIGKGEGVPAEDAAGTPDSLKTLRATYRTAMTKYLAERAKATGLLYDLYVTSLDGYVSELTRANKIDDAKKVKALREEIAAKKAATATTAAAEPPKPGLAAAPRTPAPRPVTGSYWREAAKWLTANGGVCRVLKAGVETDVKTEADMPVGKFDIVELTFDRLGSNLPLPTDADFQVFRGLKDLRRVWVRTPGLSDAAFAFLADNSDLAWLNLEGTTDVADGVLPHLAGTKKLAYLSINYAKNFTGKGLEKMRWLPVLTDVDFLASGISDDGLKALAAAPKLRFLRVTSQFCTATDAGLAAIATLPNLAILNLDSCPGFTDAGFGALATRTTLTQLDLANTALTDAGLAKLTALTKLQTLNVRGTKVTPAGVEAFKKAVPKCQVTQ